MQASDPFPVECLPRLVKETILAEFQGRHPTVHEVASVPDAHWLKLPAMGPARLARLRSLTEEICAQVQPPVLARMTKIQLLKRQDRLLTRQEQLQANLRHNRDQLRATKAELWRRGVAAQSE
ncbi:hypothetical protein AAII07_59685 [Microvirga sp. 0TCS3.31]